jgi:hypothetical protein
VATQKKNGENIQSNSALKLDGWVNIIKYHVMH